MNRKTILIDLDGVLNTYTGNFDGSFDGLKQKIENFRPWYKQFKN